MAGAIENDREEAKRLADVAISAGADVPLALAVASVVRAALTRDHDLALAGVDRAALLNPNAAAVLSFDAVTRCLCGNYDQAIVNAQRALYLSPLEPLSYHAEFALGLACLLTGRAEEAVAHSRRAIDGNRNFAFPYGVLALGCAQLGRADEAAQAVRWLVDVSPGFHIGSLRKIRFADARRLQSDLRLLRAVHLPE